MNQANQSDQDPLVEALPPATDYITYLTLLDYQLNAQNLCTLNRLLSEDDGTLVKEIGWDLLRLVLPMLLTAPKDAQKCLEIIARRGNPREVVVRVAEELEKIGESSDDLQHEGSKQQEVDENDDELLTFAGEATRIHLGNMTLDGMPKPEAQTIEDSEPVKDHADTPEDGNHEDDELKLKGLLSMLGILHPRIKTQYPSRFLATSLPASLAAYRRVPITNETTSSFLDLLSKLAGKKRPALPPRISSRLIPMSENKEVVNTSSTTALLPDPEATTEGNTDTQILSANEQAIITRLHKAVMLEVLEEYTSHLQTGEHHFMSWTSRLREAFEPKRLMPGRFTDIMLWEKTPELAAVDTLVQRFSSLGKELGLNVDDEMQVLFQSIDQNGAYHPVEAPETDEDNAESEYPTSPAQIPYPPGGIIILYALEKFYGSRKASSLPDLPLADSAHLFISLHQHSGLLSKNSSQSSLGIEDAALSLMYGSVKDPSALPSQESHHPQYFLPVLYHLSEYFSTAGHAQLRDDAHHIATRILHANPSADDRVEAIKQVFNLSTSIPTVTGHLKAVAVNWLKEEFLTHIASQSKSTKTPDKETPESTSVASDLHLPEQGINLNVFNTDPDLKSLIFPDISAPPPSSSSFPSSIFDPTSTAIIQVPCWIASLNLAFCLSSQSNAESDTVPAEATALLNNASKWCDWLFSYFKAEEMDVDAEVYALEDACTRLREVVGHKVGSNQGIVR